MEEMSFVSLINVLISSVEDKDKPRKATKEDQVLIMENG